MMQKLKTAAIAACEKHRIAQLQKANADLLEHFDGVLTRFRQYADGKPEHSPMADDLRIIVENLKVTAAMLGAQEGMAGGDSHV